MEAKLPFELKPKSTDWCDFVHRAIGETRYMEVFYLAVCTKLPHCGGGGCVWEPARHVRKTIEGIIRQVSRDFMSQQGRVVSLYKVDLRYAKVELLFQGNVHKEGCKRKKK